MSQKCFDADEDRSTWRLVLRSFLAYQFIILALALGTSAFLCEKSQDYVLCARVNDTKVTYIPGLDMTSESTDRDK
jgi:hypothetical protein